MAVNYEWDEGKDEANIAQGRPAFTAMDDFEWDSPSSNGMIDTESCDGRPRYTSGSGFIGSSTRNVEISFE